MTKVGKRYGNKEDKTEKGRNRPLSKVLEVVSEVKGEIDMDRIIQLLASFIHFLLRMKRKF